MGNTEMTKYMAAGAFQDLTSDEVSFPNSGTWLAGLAASGKYGGKLYGVPYYAGRASSRTAPTCSRRPAIKVPTSLAEFTAAAKKLAREEQGEGLLARLHRRHRLVRRDELRLRLRRARSRTRSSGKWKGTLALAEGDRRADRLQELLPAASRASKTTDETHPPVRRVRQGPGGVDGGPGWFSCCVGDKYKGVTAQFVMPSHTKGQAMPGFLGGSDLAVPVGAQQGARGRLDQRVHRATRR